MPLMLSIYYAWTEMLHRRILLRHIAMGVVLQDNGHPMEIPLHMFLAPPIGIIPYTLTLSMPRGTRC